MVNVINLKVHKYLGLKAMWQLKSYRRIIMLKEHLWKVTFQNVLTDTASIYQVLAGGPDTVQGCEPATG